MLLMGESDITWETRPSLPEWYDRREIIALSSIIIAMGIPWKLEPEKPSWCLKNVLKCAHLDRWSCPSLERCDTYVDANSEIVAKTSRY